MSKELLYNCLHSAFPNANITIQTDDDRHYYAHIVSSCFSGQNQVAQHRMVYKAINHLIPDPIHALQLHTTAAEDTL